MFWLVVSFCILLYLLRTCAKHFSQPLNVNLWFQAHSTDASVSSAAWFRTLEISSRKLKAKGELRLCETFAFRGNATWNRRLWYFDSWRSLLILNINQEIFSVNKIKQTQSQQKTKIHSLILNLNANCIIVGTMWDVELMIRGLSCSLYTNLSTTWIIWKCFCLHGCLNQKVPLDRIMFHNYRDLLINKQNNVEIISIFSDERLIINEFMLKYQLFRNLSLITITFNSIHCDIDNYHAY